MAAETLVTHGDALGDALCPVRHRGSVRKSAGLRPMVTHGDALSQKNHWDTSEGGASRGSAGGWGDVREKCVTVRHHPPETRGNLPKNTVTHAKSVRHQAVTVRHHGRPAPLSELVADIVARARRLRAPCPRHPHAFHEDKGDLVGALMDLEHLIRETRR